MSTILNVLPQTKSPNRNTQSLLKLRAELQAELPNLRARDQAIALNVSEAELTSLDIGDNVVRLEGNFKQLLKDLLPLGKLMALTRNDHCVHERKGIYDNITFYKGAHNMGVAVNPDIDLRFFMGQWEYGLAVEMDLGPKLPTLYGLQFYNAKGVAVHKIYSTTNTNLEAFSSLVKKYRAEEQLPIVIADRTVAAVLIEKPDGDIDDVGFGESWKKLKDTHDFFPLMRKYGVTRTQALRLAPEGFVTQVELSALQAILENARDLQTEIMCFVHSPGCIQIHTGSIQKLATMGEWYNILDPEFNLHLNTNALREAYIVRKPTADGMVTSIELFGEDGELIVYFFGARKPGKPELEAWRENLEAVASTHSLEV